MIQRRDQQGNLEDIQRQNENTIYQNIQDKVKAILRGKFIVANAYTKNFSNQLNLTSQGTRKRIN